MIRIGLTGTMGAGKSSVGRLFEAWGAFRIDADQLAREAVEPGRPALEEIRNAFGEGVFRSDGTLDRAGLRAVVFRDPEALRRLESIVHPAVDLLRAERLDRARAAGAPVSVLEIPLLLEKGLQEEFDVIVVVDAPPDARRARARASRGVSDADFDAMNAAQWTGERKRAAADHVIWNDDDLASLEAEARSVWEAVVRAPPASDAWDEPRFASPVEPQAASRAGSPATGWHVDLHMHTRASRDCLSNPADVVRRARELGLARIAITDHDEIDGAFEARALDPELVIVGEEVRTAEGLDLIGLFLEERIPPGGSFRDVAGEIRRQGGVVYLPHPFDSHRGTTEGFLETVRDCIDVVEGFNARIHDPRRNGRALEWASAHGLPVGAGSDAHLLREIGRGRVALRPFEGPAEFLAALADGEVKGRSSSFLVHLGSTWAKIARALRVAG